MRKWFLILVCVFMVGFLGSQGKVWAAEAECSAGDQYCKDIDTRCYCNSSYTYSCYTCSNICSKGVCVAAPTATPTPSNCTYGGTTYANGTNRCTSGTLYKCNNGSWSFYVDCTYGSCKDNTTCASCRQGTNKCNGSRLEQCNNSSWVLVENCVYGCDTSTNTCFDCTGTGISCRNGSQYKCTNGRWVYSWHCWGLGCKDGVNCVERDCGPLNMTLDSRNCKPLTNYCYYGKLANSITLEGPYCDSNGNCDPPFWSWECTQEMGECSEFWGWSQPYCGTVTCDMAWSGSQCVTNAYCKTPLGSVSGCPSGSTCCNDPWVDECKSDSDCVNIYGACYKCNNNIPRKCYRSIASGGDGNCASLGSVCSLPASGLCSSSYGSTVTDSSGTDGTFNWTCSGQSSATCRTAGSSVSCSATRSVINATCGASNQTCNNGTVTNTRSETRADGIYSLWDCNATCNGSSATGCSYKTCSRVDGACSSTLNTCAAGTVANITSQTRADGIYDLWSCNGSCSGTNASCAKQRCSRVDGACGYAAGGSSCLAPAAGLCAPGAASVVSFNAATNTFSWSCAGSCSGTTASCSSTRSIINGRCGSADGSNFTTTPTTNLCSYGDPTTVTLSGSTYSWSCISDCNGIADLCSATYDTTPDLGTTTLKTTTGRVIAIEAGGRNHSCDPAFAGSKTSVWTITATDVQGVTDIKSMTLRFRGPVTVNTSPVAAVNGVSNFSVDTTTFTPGTYNVEVLIDDVHTPPGNRGWIDTGRDFRVWDCLVNVSGTIYDGSEVPISCSANSGYTITIPSDLNFDLRYTLGSNSPRNMTVNSPNFNSDTNNRLYWNSAVDYQPLLINFPGTNPTQAKINNACYNTAALDPKIADPYSANPSLSIQYSSILDQEAWYRATSGAIVNKGVITNYIPGTCTTPECRTITGDIILSTSRASLSPYDKSVPDNLVYDNREVNLKPYSYDSLKRQYFSVKGFGTTVPASATWSEIPTKTGIIFVNGNLTIDANIATTDLVMIITKGDITVNPNVTRIDGVLMGNNIIISGKSASQLVINGSIYGIQSVVLNRSFDPKNLNNKTPAVEVKYNPSLIFKLPPKMIQTISQWRLLQ